MIQQDEVQVPLFLLPGGYPSAKRELRKNVSVYKKAGREVSRRLVFVLIRSQKEF